MLRTCLRRQRAAAALVVVAFAGLTALLLARLGVAIGGDSPRYTGGAERLLHGHGLEGTEPAYIGYILVVALAKVARVGLPGVVGLQLVVALVAACALVLLGERVGGPWCGLLAAAYFLLYPEIARWHVYVPTESLYISGVVLCVYAAERAVEKGGVAAYGWAAAVVLGVASLRPTGWLLPPVIAGYWALCRPGLRAKLTGLAGIAVVGAALVAAVPTLRAGLGVGSPAAQVRIGAVIYGDPASRLAMPATNDSGNGPLDLVRYAADHPVATTRLMAVRVLTEVAHTRRYNSRLHNAATVAVLVPVYALAAVGAYRHRRDRLVHLILAVIAAHLVQVAVYFADWDGRFLTYILPLIGLLAAAAIPLRQPAREAQDGALARALRSGRPSRAAAAS